MDEIKSHVNNTNNLLLRKDGEYGIHGRNLSGRMHRELSNLIDRSKDYNDYLRRMPRFIDRWVLSGKHVLPEGFQQKLKPWIEE